MHLAQFNVSRLLAPQDDPRLADFFSELERVNAIADRAPGFVWRLTGDGNNATGIRAYADERIIVNMSVWESIQHARAFVYGLAHSDVMRERRRWLDPDDRTAYALWWCPDGERPCVEEGKLRLEVVRKFGPTTLAFSFAHPFDPE